MFVSIYMILKIILHVMYMYVVINNLIVWGFFSSLKTSWWEQRQQRKQCPPVLPLALAMLLPLDSRPPLTPQTMRQSVPSSVSANSSDFVASGSAHVPASGIPPSAAFGPSTTNQPVNQSITFASTYFHAIIPNFHLAFPYLSWPVVPLGLNTSNPTSLVSVSESPSIHVQ